MINNTNNNISSKDIVNTKVTSKELYIQTKNLLEEKFMQKMKGR